MRLGSARLLLLAACMGLTLNACVTTTTGGFNVEASESRALNDYIQLAVGYFDAGDLAGAKRHINNALAIDDRSSEPYNILALVMQREGEPVRKLQRVAQLRHHRGDPHPDPDPAAGSGLRSRLSDPEGA